MHSGNSRCSASYRVERAETWSGQALVTIGSGRSYRRWSPIPSRSHGQSRRLTGPSRYTAVYEDGYQTEDVTAGGRLDGRSNPKQVDILGQDVQACRFDGFARPASSSPEPIATRKGAVLTKTETVTEIDRLGRQNRLGSLSRHRRRLRHQRRLQPRWQRQLAIGSSSGAVSIYAVGLTPSQYALQASHRRPCEGPVRCVVDYHG